MHHRCKQMQKCTGCLHTGLTWFMGSQLPWLAVSPHTIYLSISMPQSGHWKKGVPENFMFQLGIGPQFNHWKKEFKKTSCFLLGLTDTWLGRCTHVRWTEQQPGLHIPASMHCLWRQFEITLFSKLALYTAEFQLTSCGITYYICIKTKWAHHD